MSRPEEGQGFVKAKIEQKDDHIVCVVENSASKANILEKSDGNSGLGLLNLRKRLDLLYTERYKLEIVRTANSYKADLLIYI